MWRERQTRAEVIRRRSPFPSPFRPEHPRRHTQHHKISKEKKPCQKGRPSAAVCNLRDSFRRVLVATWETQGRARPSKDSLVTIMKRPGAPTRRRRENFHWTHWRNFPGFIRNIGCYYAHSSAGSAMRITLSAKENTASIRNSTKSSGLTHRCMTPDWCLISCAISEMRGAACQRMPHRTACSRRA